LIYKTCRLRRVLESVAAGDTVSGYVEDIIPEGVLVTITSLGPLNVTGVIPKKEMPRQYEMPADLKFSFQKQLIQQDFATGRKVVCGVAKINPTSPVNLRLTFEEFGEESSPEDSLDKALESVRNNTRNYGCTYKSFPGL